MDATITLNQLTQSNNGINRLKAMIGAYNFIKDKNTVSFRFKAKSHNKSNYCKITLNSLDYYDVEFFKIRLPNIKSVETINNVDCESLMGVFEEKTKLYLKL